MANTVSYSEEPIPPEDNSAPPVVQSEADDSESMPLVVIERFPFGNPRAPTSDAYQGSIDNMAYNALGDPTWGPFNSKCDWDIACWSKRHNITSSAMAKFLAMSEVWKLLLIHYFLTNAWWKVVHGLGLSYSTTKELNNMVNSLPGCPPFVYEELTIRNEQLKFHYWDILSSIWALYGDFSFWHDLVFTPERHFTDDERMCRIYNEMHTGDWWWSVQVRKLVSRILCST